MTRAKEVMRQTQVTAGKCDRNREGATKPDKLQDGDQRRSRESAINRQVPQLQSNAGLLVM